MQCQPRVGARLTAGQFTSEDLFDEFGMRLRSLTRGLINAVAFNIEEVMALGGDPDNIAEAQKRVASAQTAFNRGDLSKAADAAQRAYDLIEGEVNVGPDCLVDR